MTAASVISVGWYCWENWCW